MNTILNSITFTTYPRNIFLANITGGKRSQTKTTSSARFLIKHMLGDINLVLLELAMVIV
jgi:hypothetical protein